MIEELPLWLSVPLIVILILSALYKCYVLPGYEKDKRKKMKNEQADLQELWAH